jgi:hypothetical protein
MTNSDWRARVVQARTERDDLRPKRVWVFHKDGREAAIDVKAVPGLGAEIVLTVDGQWRKTRLFRSHQQAELVGAIADTRMMLEGTSARRSASCGARHRGFDARERGPAAVRGRHGLQSRIVRFTGFRMAFARNRRRRLPLGC